MGNSQTRRDGQRDDDGKERVGRGDREAARERERGVRQTNKHHKECERETTPPKL